MRAFVTGGGGFAGQHLAAELLAGGHSVLLTGLGEPPQAGAARWAELDVTDTAACQALLAAERPEWIFHLAGYAHVGQAEREPERCLAVNFGGSRSLLEAALAAAPQARVLVASSAEVYGRVPQERLPVTEDLPLSPATIYAVSKAAAEMAAHHAAARGLDVLILRPFNHIGPGQSESFITANFARQLARIELGRSEPVLRVGNLQAVRDVADVRDTVRAYRLLAERGRTGEVYNVTSGRAVAMQELVDTLVTLCPVPVRVEPDPARMRPLDVPFIQGSGAKLEAETGFRFTRGLRDTLRDVLAYWRAIEAGGGERR
ncbi:MAG: NAD-dependent epimerase/dehydratase family protein [Planctomycetota bacterium]